MSAETETQDASWSPLVTRGAAAVGIAMLLATLYVALIGDGLPTVTAAEPETGSGLEALGSQPEDIADRLEGFSTGGSIETEFELVEGVEVPVGMPTDEPDEIRMPLDPLSEEEAGYARFLALKAAGAGEKLDGTDGYEFQYVQIPSTRTPDETRRLAEVVSYDYATDSPVVQVVDLNSGEVELGESYVPPTPNEAESLRAMEIFLDDPASAQLRAQYEEWTGEELESIEDFYFAGGNYLDPTDGSIAIPECEDARCVQFQALTWDGMVLVPGDFVVDLSAGVVREIAPS
jgi:hypothetical protein